MKLRSILETVENQMRSRSLILILAITLLALPGCALRQGPEAPPLTPEEEEVRLEAEIEFNSLLMRSADTVVLYTCHDLGTDKDGNTDYVTVVDCIHMQSLEEVPGNGPRERREDVSPKVQP